MLACKRSWSASGEMTHWADWIEARYNRLMDGMNFIGYIFIGLALAYSPPSDSMAFIQRVFLGMDRRFLAWIFFILPSPIFLMQRRWIWKFAGVAPLAFMLASISWFLVIAPNRSWFVAPVFMLALARMCLHYIRLIARDYIEHGSN